MLSGIVVVATPAGGAAQQLTAGVTGLSFEHGDHRALADRIEELIAQPKWRAEMAGRALEEARKRYSSAAMARRVAETYAETLRAASPR
jgi:glycosyltransferase involved in cell wall biosynthesis